MTAFPGAVYTASGKRVDRKGSPLSAERLHAFKHRAVASRRADASVIAVWTLRDDALFRIIPPSYREDMADWVCSGSSVLVLGNNPDLVQDVRSRLLASADAAAYRLGMAA